VSPTGQATPMRAHLSGPRLPAAATMGARRRASPNSRASSATPAISDASPPLPCLAQIGGRPRLAPGRRRPSPPPPRARPAVARSYLPSGRRRSAPPLPCDNSHARCREAGHWLRAAGRRPAGGRQGCLFSFLKNFL
jgi:hypothetical protein